MGIVSDVTCWDPPLSGKKDRVTQSHILVLLLFFCPTATAAGIRCLIHLPSASAVLILIKERLSKWYKWPQCRLGEQRSRSRSDWLEQCLCKCPLPVRLAIRYYHNCIVLMAYLAYLHTSELLRLQISLKYMQRQQELNPRRLTMHPPKYVSCIDI